MRVLGIDPGLTRCGVGVIDVDAARRARLVHVGVIRSDPGMPLAERLWALSRGLRSAIESYAPDAVAVERVFAQHNVSTVMGTAQASGIALALAAEHGLPIGLHTPSEVKAAVTGYGSAEKAQVGAMVARLLRLDAPPSPADAADALAIALCHAWRGSAQTRVHEARAGAAARGGVMSGETPAQRAWRAAERRTAAGATGVRA